MMMRRFIRAPRLLPRGSRPRAQRDPRGSRRGARMKRLIIIALVISGCATTSPPPAAPAVEHLHGVASWYGQEFAGRTTANGEIFDPMLFTAAHRTLPFGTIVEVKNAKSSKIV